MEDRHASLGDVYEHNETTRDEQLTACSQRLEEQVDRFGGQFEWFGDQIGALTE